MMARSASLRQLGVLARGHPIGDPVPGELAVVVPGCLLGDLRLGHLLPPGPLSLRVGVRPRLHGAVLVKQVRGQVGQIGVEKPRPEQGVVVEKPEPQDLGVGALGVQLRQRLVQAHLEHRRPLVCIYVPGEVLALGLHLAVEAPLDDGVGAAPDAYSQRAGLDLDAELRGAAHGLWKDDLEPQKGAALRPAEQARMPELDPGLVAGRHLGGHRDHAHGVLAPARVVEAPAVRGPVLSDDAVRDGHVRLRVALDHQGALPPAGLLVRALLRQLGALHRELSRLLPALADPQGLVRHLHEGLALRGGGGLVEFGRHVGLAFLPSLRPRFLLPPLPLLLRLLELLVPVRVGGIPELALPESQDRVVELQQPPQRLALPEVGLRPVGAERGAPPGILEGPVELPLLQEGGRPV
mmetsp:Transcript_115433/g.313340  ORF Transcript_115433/g.313340 Transcript_115433/m.313340 type:complete len:409 (-) Transcript_115433:183-1409(-)